jgi:hypothetical protein
MWGMRRALLLACVLALAGCGGSDEASRAPAQSPAPTLPGELLHLYDYDTSAPFDEQEVKPDGRITAFYIVPNGDGPFPAVLFMPGAPGARFTFFSEAVELAGRGIASLLPDPPYARPPIQDVVEFTPSDKDGIVQEVVETIPRRIRVGSFVLMSAIPRLSADMRQLGEERGAAPEDLAGYEEAMKPIDAVNYLPHVAPNALFLQFGSEDTRPSPEMGQEADDAASKPKQAKWYQGGHELNDQARTEREDWLAGRLGVS